MTTNPQHPRLTAPDSYKMQGCLMEGHKGQYIYDEIIELAVDCGFDDDDITIRDMDDNLTDAAIEMAVLAEEWLNEHIAQEGWSFGWYDGEFFYQRSAWFNEEAVMCQLFGGVNYGEGEPEPYDSIHDAAMDWINRWKANERHDRDGLATPLWAKELTAPDVAIYVMDGKAQTAAFTVRDLMSWALIEEVL